MQHRDARSAKALNTGELTFREDVERSARPRDGRGCLHEAVLHPQRPLGAHIAASAIGIAIARQGMPGAGCRRWNRTTVLRYPGTPPSSDARPTGDRTAHTPPSRPFEPDEAFTGVNARVFATVRTSGVRTGLPFRTPARCARIRWGRSARTVTRKHLAAVHADGSRGPSRSSLRPDSRTTARRLRKEQRQ